ncbi:uncharacterized protein LOC111638620 [Centruroides sculpturatus]|uniref:uncharacterized protein LOC111638620 n=1 Tax=Centruroides sculpturatus TaxID=218467 RepID=UPI000C6D0556|nr:uncharacterized protein LOC111638620 [Centruroides sculpturatus]
MDLHRAFLFQFNEVERDYFRWKMVFRKKERHQVECKEGLNIKYTKEWLTKNQLVLTKADKTKQMVIMKRGRYNEAIKDYIRKTECDIVDEKIVTVTNNRVKKLEKTPLAKHMTLLKKSHNPCSRIPRIFAFAKTHKESKEIRPVVEKCSAPTFILKRRLKMYIYEDLEDNMFVAHDPNKLVKELQELVLMNDEVGKVMDFESMYPSMNLTSCFNALIEFIVQDNPGLSAYMEDLNKLADLMCYQSLFTFYGIVYKQRKGVPMGSPMSGLLCELVVRQLEKEVLGEFMEDIILYKRYVDDVLIIWKDERRIEEFLSMINNNNHGLKLKLEQKSPMQIHFLDIDIKFKQGCVQAAVYLKPTHAPLYIPAWSNDPFRYKMSSFKALIKRAFLYCTNIQDRLNEINRIKKVAKNLGYKTSTINGLIKGYKQGTSKRDGRKNRFNKFTYNKNVEGIMEELCTYKDTRTVYKRAPNIYRLLRNDKDKVGMKEKAGVYRIPFENQQLGVAKDYVGVTTRNLGVRIKEHMYDVSKGHNNTILAIMAQTDGASVKWDEAKIIKPVHSPTIAFGMEKMEIYKSKINNNCLNAKDANALPTAWKYVIEKQVGIKNP